MTKKKPHKLPKKSAAVPPPMMPTGGAEKSMQDLHRLLSQQNFESIEDANQFMQQLLASSGGFIPETKPSSALEEAQDLIYKAREIPSRTQRIKLARQALEISADCADAYVLLAEDSAKTPAEARAFYEQAVRVGEKALGKDAFEEMVGHFWGIMETRPYMRARLGLAQVLQAMGENQQAADHMQEMLRLNSGDNQGVRYMLASLLLQIGNDSSLENLLAQYPDDWSANWKYTSALLAFRKEGQTERANSLLSEAIKYNTFVPAYLLGRKRLPKQMPTYISPGQENEAIDYIMDAVLPWRQTPDAIKWLKEMLVQKNS